MSVTEAADAAPLNDAMLAMDVVDTLRHRQDLVERELLGDARGVKSKCRACATTTASTGLHHPIGLDGGDHARPDLMTLAPDNDPQSPSQRCAAA